MSLHQHISVMLDEAVLWWAGRTPSQEEPVRNPAVGTYIDGTFGRGGHSRALLAHLDTSACLLGVDKDPAAVEVGRQLASEDARFNMAWGSFAELHELCAQHNLDQVQGILLDLGVSSPQLDDAERGFSFTHDGPLDMRMNPEQGESAADWINRVPEQEMADVFYQYGEERFSRRMARAIVERRRETPFTRTGDLAEVVKAANPRWEKHKHPATRVFQAIRIHINGELGDLETGLAAAMERLAPGGRLVVISFHSLEDRLVKRFMRREAQGDPIPRGLPVQESAIRRRLRLLVKGRKATEQEVAENPRARSAVLRVAERLADPTGGDA
ncbi:16S rRNA (cytosine(1402)-N(4))-methyltransferase RsmH [Natronospirillum operosum]|uniref:Ribosomal RNA small subunit methyltransferase H n=1 Tax=Natronospirillum operosum TaxID=2759953 RepID=A0A4Z0WDB4_9GAMM|nr:16S rRNA (cytosine(1402)-N(4))-methyltransferase RsmH [Natronospirillum operosum]TGG92719.1 16S rRNA (cytosine(1402)-N(4))-methyltransferase RsmH [Natronospirillum operosum]